MISIVLLLFSIVLFAVVGKKRTVLNLPPGPISLPIVGNLFHLATSKKKAFYQTCQDLSKKYGPITYIKLGKLNSVVFDDYEHIKEVGNSGIWIDKYYNDWVAERSFGKLLGVVFIGGEVQKEMRRFSVRTLRDFGFGKQKNMEGTIEEELIELSESLQQRVEHGDGLVDMKQFFTISVLNILWSMVASTRFDKDDQKLQELLMLLHKTTKANATGSVNNPLFLYSAFPFTAKIPFLFSKQNAERKEVNNKFCAFFKNVIDERRATGEYKEEQRDFIDVFLQKIDSNRNVSPEINQYTEEQLIVVLMDLFMAGSETTSNTIEYAILFMVLNPEIQSRVQAEIDSVIGTRLPMIADMTNMPYTHATILEVQRKSNILPVFRRSPMQDTIIGNYNIPKGTIGICNLYSLHMNEKTWKNPHEFEPTRFLDSNNNIINSDKILPFGFGKRRCLGEALAKVSIFTFLTTLLQKFNFEYSPEHGIPTDEPDIGFSLSPQQYYVLVKERVYKTNDVP